MLNPVQLRATKMNMTETSFFTEISKKAKVPINKNSKKFKKKNQNSCTIKLYVILYVHDITYKCRKLNLTSN